MTTIQLSTVTLQLCPTGKALYDAFLLCAEDVKSVPCNDTVQDCRAAMRDYFKHRRGVRRADGYYIANPCPYCRVGTYGEGG